MFATTAALPAGAVQARSAGRRRGISFIIYGRRDRTTRDIGAVTNGRAGRA